MPALTPYLLVPVHWLQMGNCHRYCPCRPHAGLGNLVFANGDKYEGHWQNGKMTGNGDFWAWLDGKYFLTYRGEWRNGKYEVRKQPHALVTHNAKGNPTQPPLRTVVRPESPCCTLIAVPDNAHGLRQYL
jgi:hypothetical protein